MSDEPVTISRDPLPYWNAEEVGVLTAVDLAEMQKDNGKPYSWHPLVPVGKFHHPKFGLLEFNADDAADFAANFKAGVRGSDIPVDEVGAHETTPGGAAYGWLEEVRVTSTGLEGKIGWNKRGQEALADDEYRYISPTLHTKGLPFTAKDGSKVGNVIKSICLTNRPVFKGQPALTVNMAEYEEESGLAEADTIDEVATDERSTRMTTNGLKELAEAQAAEVAAAEPQEPVAEDAAPVTASEEIVPVDVTALTVERDGLLAEVQTLKDKIAEMEQATVTASEPEPEPVRTAESPTPEAIELAETKRRLQALEDERALELAEKHYRELTIEGNRVMGKADITLAAKFQRALPATEAAEFAEWLGKGGPTFVQMGEAFVHYAKDGTDPGKSYDARKLYEQAIKNDPDAELTEQTANAVVKFGEGEEKAFADFDALYAAFAEAGKPGLR